MTNSIAHAVGEAQGQNLVVTVLTTQMKDAEVSYGLRDEIVAMLDKFQSANIVVDLGKVTFIGSIGFLAFLGVRRHLGEGRVVLCNVSQPIQKMFAVCRLIPTEANSSAPFEIQTTRAAALACLSG